MSPTGAAGLTRRGWALLAVAGVMGAAAFLFGIEELYPIAAAALVAVVAGRAWVSHQSWDLRVGRHIHPARVPAGYEARVELSVRNYAGRRSPLTSAADPFDGGKRWARFLIAPIGPGETRTASYRLPTSRRGVFQLGPLLLEISDPFGLARSSRASSPDATLTVHPRIEPLSARSISAHSDRDTRLPLPVLGRGGDEFYGLRDYEPGDDVRLVHWPTTARVDDLVVRQPENLWRGRITVVVDLRSGVHGTETLEPLLAAAASVASAGIRSGLHVRMVTTAGVDTGFGATGHQLAAVLDALAAAETHGGSSLAEVVRMLRTGDPLTLMTTDAATEADVGSIVRVGGGPHATTVVVFGRNIPDHERVDTYLALGSGRLVTVRPGDSFRAAWEGVSC